MINEQQFKQTMALFASGVTVITWHEGNQTQGITVSSFASLSLNPPLVLFCIDHNAYIFPEISMQNHVGLSILSAEQTDIAYRFAGPDRTNLESIIHQRNEQSCPMIEHAQATMLLKIREQIAQGDHDIFIAEVISSEVDTSRQPLLYYNGRISDNAAL
ncbi:flavin reductase family protein [Suttonella sp. R2A3]|uniref:flavin reductase family protein n=1 Tax=Suttonella sp. R2A3 TaxID=2908648 RepID=UPI001F4308D3|nr:flavin reductase family protein [Suttonella sp. R2A3]UJF24979.1 flavin reductase family protein [Suttonella sp. R2A3]